MKEKTDQQLEASVFRYPSSEADKKFFKQRIVDFLQEKPAISFIRYMFKAVHERNNNGLTLKYCYFNEHQQRVYLEKDFYTWMTRTKAKAEKELTKLKTFL